MERRKEYSRGSGFREFQDSDWERVDGSIARMEDIFLLFSRLFENFFWGGGNYFTKKIRKFVARKFLIIKLLMGNYLSIFHIGRIFSSNIYIYIRNVYSIYVHI